MSLYILDTDHMSLIERLDNRAGFQIRNRMDQVLSASDSAATTVITFEEQVRGWMSRLAKAKTISQQVYDYQKLNQLLENYRAITVLDFDEKSGLQYQALLKARIRIGTMDLKIAATAIANNATLLSRNLKDFNKVPGLKVEDWAA
jgi:tRNA(fMet)-specific endonuclease VapC